MLLSTGTTWCVSGTRSQADSFIRKCSGNKLRSRMHTSTDATLTNRVIKTQPINLILASNAFLAIKGTKRVSMMKKNLTI